MTRRIELALVALVILFIVIGVTLFAVSMYKIANLPNLQDIEQVTEVPAYRWNQCFDNDYPAFNQEYPDTKADKAFAEAKKDNPSAKCSWNYRGDGGILGCTGDLFYSFTCK